MLSQIQQAAVGYRGAQYFAGKTNGYTDYEEKAALGQLYRMYTDHYGFRAFEAALRQADGGQCVGLDAGGSAIQGAVWLAQNTNGYMNHEEEDKLENMFNLYARTYGEYNLAMELKSRLDPVAYEAIRNQPWWKW